MMKMQWKSGRALVGALLLVGLLGAAQPTLAATTLVSTGNPTRGVLGNNHSFTEKFSYSAGGSTVAFVSRATNLVEGDTNGVQDIFVRDLRTGTTTRASVSSNGAQANGDSFNASLNSDGSKVAFVSHASNLVESDTNGVRDIFVRDLRTGMTTRVNVSSSGAQANANSEYSSLSADGTKVAFASTASNLVAGDTNGVQDIFVRDLTTGMTTRASVDSSGAQANGGAPYPNPSLSSDGSKVAFESEASNLVAGDTNGVSDIFVRDLRAGTTTRVSVSSSGAQATGSSENPGLSSDGSTVAFESTAPNLVAGDTNSGRDIFVRDLTTGTTTRASVDSSGAQNVGDAQKASLSSDGSKVAFQSHHTNRIEGDNTGWTYIFVRDLRAGTTTRVSISSSGAQPNGGSSFPCLSGDGSKVAFHSDATNHVAGDNNGRIDVFVRNISLGTTTLVSRASDTAMQAAGGNSFSNKFSLSSDGSKVAFESSATNLVAGDTNGVQDIFVRDLTTGTTTRVSVSSSGAQATGGGSFYPSLSGDGSKVAFTSDATNLVAGDTNGSRDIFVRDLATGTTTRVSVDSNEAQANGGSFAPCLSSDGSKVAFESDATNLVAGDTNGVRDIFVRDLATGTTTRVSLHSNGAQANSGSANPSLSGDGSKVAFQSFATNLVAGDTNGRLDIFVRDLAMNTTTRVSLHSNGAQVTGGNSANPSLSGDGSKVAFTSDATNLVAGDTNGGFDIFVRDLATGTTTRVSLDSNGAQVTGDSFAPSLSSDGSKVAFYSDASNLIGAGNDSNGMTDIFVRDRTLGTTERVSVADDESQATNNSFNPAISADGLKVAFQSDASNLVAGDTNGLTDVFVSDVVFPATLSISDVTANEGQAGTTDFIFTVTRSGDTRTAVTVDYALANVTTGASDYGTASDSDGGTPGTLTIAAGATNGTITVPVNGDSTDEDDETFTVTLSNPTGATITTATGTGTITDDNDAPTASDSNQSVTEDTPTNLTMGASDINTGDTLTYTITQSPTNGSLTNADGSAIVNNQPATNQVKYTPNADYNGADSFKFKANDGIEDSNEATVSITVGPVNDAPVLDNSGFVQMTVQGQGSSIEDILLYSSTGDPITDVDNDPEGIAITFADTKNGSWQYYVDGTQSWQALGVVSATNARLLKSNGATTRLRFLPKSGVSGRLSDQLSFRAWDQTTGSEGSLASTTPNGGATAFSSAVESLTVIVPEDSAAPLVTISTPAYNAVLKQMPAQALGTASEGGLNSSGIRSVTVRLYRYANPINNTAAGYWNGNLQTPQFNATYNAAVHERPAITSTAYANWNLALPSGGGKYFLIATAIDGVGKKAALSHSFTVNDGSPQVNITQPVQSRRYKSSQLPLASGTAYDDNAITHVSVRLYRYANATTGTPGGFWNGNSANPQFALLYNPTTHERPTTLNGADWSLGLPALAAGRYALTATAYDGANNSNFFTHSFFITDGTPKVSITSPQAGVSYPSGSGAGSLNAVTGTASDSNTAGDPNGDGIVGVTVRLHRKASFGNSEGYWNGTAFTMPYNPTVHDRAASNTASGGTPAFSTWSRSIPSLSVGDYSVVATAYDALGNFSHASTGVQARTTAQSAAPIQAPPTQTAESAGVSFSIVAAPTVSESKLSGAEAISSSNSITLTIAGAAPQGTFSVQVNGEAVKVNNVIRGQQDAQGQQTVTLLLPDGSLQAGDEVQVSWAGGNTSLIAK